MPATAKLAKACILKDGTSPPRKEALFRPVHMGSGRRPLTLRLLMAQASS